MVYGYELEDLANYPGDLVLRTSSSKIAQSIKKEMEENKDSFYSDDKEQLFEFIRKDLESSSKLANIVTMTIISDSLEESVIISEKVNKKTSEIIDNILEKVLAIFLKENELDDIGGNEDEFEHYVSNLEGSVSLKLKISGRDHENKRFSSDVILRSNGGYDEIIKALPFISSEEYMKRKIQHAIEQ